MRDNFETRATTTKAYHDRKAGNAKPVLKPGDRVRARIQGSWTPAMVIDRSDNPRSYIIRMNNGTEMRRNNHDLRLSREESRRASQERTVTVTVDQPYLCRNLRALRLLRLSRIAHFTSHDLAVSVKSLPDLWTNTAALKWRTAVRVRTVELTNPDRPDLEHPSNIKHVLQKYRYDWL